MIGRSESYYERVARFNTTEKYADECDRLLAAANPGPAHRVLDLGCGTGTFLATLRARGLNAVGLDGHDCFQRFAGTSLPVARGDARSLPFKDAVFDRVTLMHVLAHIEQHGVALTEVHRVLRPGGRIAVITPNRAWLEARSWLRWFDRFTPDPTVEGHFDQRELEQSLRAAGFDRIQIQRFGKRPWPWPLPGAGQRERLLAVAEREAD